MAGNKIPVAIVKIAASMGINSRLNRSPMG